jgi:hypothetical protein
MKMLRRAMAISNPTIQDIIKNYLKSHYFALSMKDKNVIFSLCLVLTVLAILVSRIQHEPQKAELFNRHPKNIFYSKRALCEMKCFHIENKDIELVMKKGIINFSHSDLKFKPCPELLVQGLIPGSQTLQIHFMQCNDKTTVLSCQVKRSPIICSCF